MAGFSWIDQQGQLVTKAKIENHFLGMIVYCNDSAIGGVGKARTIRFNGEDYKYEMWTVLYSNHPDVKKLKTMMLLEGVEF